MRKAHSSALFHPESLEWEWSGLSGPFEHYTGQPSLGFPPAYWFSRHLLATFYNTYLAAITQRPSKKIGDQIENLVLPAGNFSCTWFSFLEMSTRIQKKIWLWMRVSKGIAAVWVGKLLKWADDHSRSLFEVGPPYLNLLQTRFDSKCSIMLH